MSETDVVVSPESAAAQAIETAVSRERARIAREIHDNIATDLAAAIAIFKVHMERKDSSKDPTLQTLFEEMERMLKNVRATLSDLRPRPIGPEGLMTDLRKQADEFSRLYGIRVELSSNGTEEELPNLQREVVFHVVREALTNVRKHSGSSICRVRLAFAAHPFLVEVADEGRGFAASSGGYGLVGMRERAAGIGGRLEVVSTEGQGTRVFLFGPQ